MMREQMEQHDRLVRRWPWVVLFVLSGLLAVTVLYILVAPVDPNDFESTTGLSWHDFSASNPEVADYLAREARILAIGYLGLAAVVFALGDGRVLATFYAVVTVIAAGSLVAAHRAAVGPTHR